MIDRVDPSSNADRGHAEGCPRCSARLAAVATSHAVLGEVLTASAPTPVGAIDDEAILEGIYGRALRAAEAKGSGEEPRGALRAALAAGLAPITAPGDVAWREHVPHPATASWLRRWMGRREHAPSWVWRRVNARVAAERGADGAGRRRLVRRFAAFAAAALILITVLIELGNSSEFGGTAPQLKFVDMNNSLAASSGALTTPHRLVLDLARRP